MRQHRQCLPYTQTRRLQLNMLVNFFLLWLCSLGPALCTPCLPAFGRLPTSCLALSLSPIHGRIKLGRIKSSRVHAISIKPLCLRHTTRMVTHSIIDYASCSKEARSVMPWLARTRSFASKSSFWRCSSRIFSRIESTSKSGGGPVLVGLRARALGSAGLSASSFGRWYVSLLAHAVSHSLDAGRTPGPIPHTLYKIGFLRTSFAFDAPFLEQSTKSFHAHLSKVWHVLLHSHVFCLRSHVFFRRLALNSA